VSPSDYSIWNQSLCKYLFSTESAGKPVYLESDDDFLKAVAESVENQSQTDAATDPWSSLTDAVKSTLNFDSNAPLDWHVSQANSWRKQSRQRLSSQSEEVSFPPTIGLLVFLSRIAAEMGEGDDFNAVAYYPRVKLALSLSDKQASQFEKAYPKHSENLWRSLNEYLTWTNGRHGTPTAYALGKRYVGLPQSQALVRAIDRARLPFMFKRFRLKAGGEVLPSDMVRLFDAWIGEYPSAVSKNLHTLWSRLASRDRIAGIISNELAAWDGALPSSGAGSIDYGNASSGSLVITANRRRGIRKSLDISLLVTLLGDSEAVEVSSAENKPRMLLETVDGVRSRPTLDTRLDVSSLLESSVTLTDQDAGLTATRNPRRIIPLQLDDRIGFYVEVERVDLLENHLVIVQDDPKVLKAFHDLMNGQIGRFGEELTSDGANGSTQLSGIPTGWRVYSEVQVLKAPDADPSLADASALVPFQSMQLTLSGGLQMPGQIRKYSSLCAPAIGAVVSHDQNLSVLLKSNDDEILHEWTSDVGALVIPLDELKLEDGDYIVELLAGKKPVGQKSLRLRSSDMPDGVSWENAVRLVHNLTATPLSALSADHADGDSDGQLIIDGPWATPLLESEEVLPPPADKWWDKSKSPAKTPTLGSELRLGQANKASCALTGAHNFPLPTAGATKPTSAFVESACKHCGLVKRFPTRPKWKKSKGLQAAKPLTQFVDFSNLPPSPPRPITWDFALDALIHVGGGKVGALERVAVQVDTSPLFRREFISHFELTGNIDFRRNQALEVVEWEVPPTYLFELADGTWQLAGSWNNYARSQLREAIAHAKGVFATVKSEDGPTRFKVSDISAATLAEISEIHGWTLAPEAAIRIAEALPFLSDVREELSLIDLPEYGSATIYNPESDSWIPCGAVVRPGAYRLKQSFRTYDLFVTGDSLEQHQGLLGTVELNKHLAALDFGRPLAYYVSDYGHLVVPLGADLPGLYGRAAALCSGVPPRKSTNTSLLAYSDVSEHVAGILTDRLSK
jgi:hypothetical protein